MWSVRHVKKKRKLSHHWLGLQTVYLNHTDNTHSWFDSSAYDTAPRNPSPPFCKHRWSFSHFLWPLRHTATALKTNVPEQALPQWYKEVKQRGLKHTQTEADTEESRQDGEENKTVLSAFPQSSSLQHFTSLPNGSGTACNMEQHCFSWGCY